MFCNLVVGRVEASQFLVIEELNCFQLGTIDWLVSEKDFDVPIVILY